MQNVDHTGEYIPGVATVDLGAVRHNLGVLGRHAPQSEIMAIVKADGYGHGRLPVALAALSAGVTRLGVSQVSEGLKLRAELDAEGIDRQDASVFAWLADPDQNWGQALDADLELSASSIPVLRRIAQAVRESGRRAPVHLKVDVGMSRAGALGEDYFALVAEARRLEEAGHIEVIGIWSHLPAADDLTEEGRATVGRQTEVFLQAVAQARAAGLDPRWQHLAATGGTIWHPRTRGNMVRIGIGMYGLSPDATVASSGELGLRPALSLRAPLVLVKRLPAGAGVSYGGTWRTEEPTWVGLVPLGYADGIPRHASNVGPVTVLTGEGPYSSRVLGRVCMDQFVIDLGTGDEPVAGEGDTAVLIGNGPGEPSADDWARECGTINYEVVTRLAPTIRRDYEQGGAELNANLE